MDAGWQMQVRGMIEEIGTVVETRGRLAMVQTERGGACAGCASATFCHMAEGEKDAIVEAENGLHAAVGQKVRVAVPTSVFLTGTLFLYMFPLAGLFGGMACGFMLAQGLPGADHDLLAAAGSILGLILFLLIQRLFNNRFRRSHRFRPVISQMIDAPSTITDPDSSAQ
ncbi:MAG: SoxR reducing system RseC family protein [bacterium]|nr:SoxR reducing system RseC family protein [bacterium]